MGTSDSVGGMAGKAKDVMTGHGDEVEDVVDKVSGKADDMTGNKQTGKIQKGANAAKDVINKPGGNKK